MTAGFVVFGVAVIAYAFALREALAGWSWLTMLLTGAATLGAAAFPLGASDGVHGAFAVAGYAMLAATPLLAVPAFRPDRPGWAGFSVAAGTVAAFCLVATAFGAAHGLLQRLGLTAGDVWIVATAIELLRSGQLVASVGTPKSAHA
jgi:hypothetical protein